MAGPDRGNGSFAVRNECDQLEEAITATRQGDAFSARAVAAPRAKQRAGDGPGGSGSSEPVPSICAKAPRLEIVDEP